MSERLLGRRLRLTIARASGKAFFPDGNDGNAIVVTSLRATFKIEKSLGKDPNACEFVIYNLAPATRAAFDKLPLHCRIDVGYETDAQLSRIFTGDVTFASSKHDGVNWTTRGELGDGARAFAQAHASRTFKAGVSGKDLVAEIATTMGLKAPTSIASAKELVGQFSSGYTLDAPSQKAMTDVLGKHGMGWSVQDGNLQILRPGETNGTTAIVISQKLGMIGSPDYGGPKKAGESPVLKVKTLLDARISAGGLIQLDAEAVKGPFRVQKVTHVGDTRSGPWETEVEAKPL